MSHVPNRPNTFPVGAPISLLEAAAQAERNAGTSFSNATSPSPAPSAAAAGTSWGGREGNASTNPNISSSALAAILARQRHAARLAEIAAAEYERAAADLERETSNFLRGDTVVAGGGPPLGLQMQPPVGLAMAVMQEEMMLRRQLFGGGDELARMLQLQQLQQQRAWTQQQYRQQTSDEREGAASAPTDRDRKSEQIDAAEAVLSLKQTGKASLAKAGPLKKRAGKVAESAAAGLEKPPISGEANMPSTGVATKSQPIPPWLVQSSSSGLPSRAEQLPTATAKDNPTSAKSLEQRKGKSGGGRSGEKNGSNTNIAQQGKGGRAKRGKKLPGQPRRPLSAYNIFFSEERERIINASGRAMQMTMSLGDGVDSEEADEDQTQESQGPPKKRRLSQQGSSHPDVTATATAKACQLLLDRRLNPAKEDKKRRHRKTHGKVSFKDLAKQIGQKWKSLPADKLAKYKQLAEMDMKRYREDMEKFNAMTSAQSPAPVGT